MLRHTDRGYGKTKDLAGNSGNKGTVLQIMDKMDKLNTKSLKANFWLVVQWLALHSRPMFRCGYLLA